MRLSIIIGAGPGLAKSIAQKFGIQGFVVALIARCLDSLNQVSDELTRLGIEVYVFPADVGDFTGLQRILVHIQQVLGDAHVLIYNSAALTTGEPLELNQDIFMDEQRVNFGGLLVAAKAVVPQMQRLGGGTILVSGADIALQPVAAYTALSVGKTGLRTLAECLRQQLVYQHIHVATVISIGNVKTGTHFDPDRIAQVYWELYQQTPRQWEFERVYR